MVGQHASIISDIGSTHDVGPFTPDFVAFQNLPIVDAAMITQRYKPRIQNIMTTIFIFAVIISEYLYHWVFSHTLLCRIHIIIYWINSIKFSC